MAWVVRPPGSISEGMAVTLPEMPLWIGADTFCSLSPTTCPTATVSPTLTVGIQGAPICWDMGSRIFSGGGITTVSLSAVFL